MKNNILMAMFVLILGVFTQNAHAVQIELTGACSTYSCSNTYLGGQGLFLGEYYNPNTQYGDFRWEQEAMFIDDVTGDATISGTMERRLDGSVWGFSISLTDATIFSTANHSTYDASVNEILNTTIDPFNFSDRASLAHDAIQWGSLSMTITKPNGSTSVIPTDWQGMDGTGDNYCLGSGGCVAALVNLNGSLFYHAWYESEGYEYKYKDKYGNIRTKTYYDFGDSKAYGTVVPVPAAVWLFASALGLLGLRRKYV